MRQLQFFATLLLMNASVQFANADDCVVAIDAGDALSYSKQAIRVVATSTVFNNCKKLHDGTQSCHDVEKCSDKLNGSACQKCADRLCEAQAEPFKDTKPPGSELLLVNGQHQPTLTITADTWVRLRLGLIASKDYL